MIQEPESNGKMAAKARDLIAAGRVRLTEGGASVTNDAGHVYRVDFDLGGHPHCQCRGFEHRGWCKHLTAAYMAQGAADGGKPEDEEPTEEELAAYAQQDEDDERVRQFALDAGLDYGDYDSAAYALAW